MTKLLASALFAATLVAAPAAHAIDIENQDGVDHQVSVTVQGGPGFSYPHYTFTLKAGEIHKDACMGEPCTVELGNSSFGGGSGTELTVKDGKLQPKPKAPRG